MAGKSNIRSMRFSDEIMEMIESQEGENFTTKFENLVRTCMIELPWKQRELKEIQERIQRERNNLRYIMDTKRKLEANLQLLERRTAYAVSEIDQAIRKIQDTE